MIHLDKQIKALAMILDRFLFGGTGLGHTEYRPFCGAEQWKININFTTPLQ